MIVPWRNNCRLTGKVRINWVTSRFSCRNDPRTTIQSEITFNRRNKNCIPHHAILKSARSSLYSNNHHQRFRQSWMSLTISSWMYSINKTLTKRVSKTSFLKAWCRLGLQVEQACLSWITDFLMSYMNNSLFNRDRPRTKKTDPYSRNS